jgi:hypothetical protein
MRRSIGAGIAMATQKLLNCCVNVATVRQTPSTYLQQTDKCDGNCESFQEALNLHEEKLI